MATYFALRSPYLEGNRHMRVLEAQTPLAWFQAMWPRFLGEEAVTAQEAFGVEDLYYFEAFQESIREEALPAPRDEAELQSILSTKWYCGDVRCKDDLILLETDDDEVELAFMWASEAVWRQKEAFSPPMRR